jgi:enoyl-[acyl-carrier protein] reductase I
MKRIMSYGLLKGKKGIVFGAMVESSLAWAIAEAIHREGGEMILSNAPVTKRFGKLSQLSEQTGGSPVIYADATSDTELKDLYEQAKVHFGGQIDFIVHSIGMSLNVRKEIEYPELNYEFLHKTLDISAISLHRCIRYAVETGALADGGSIVALTYIGAQRTFSKYSEMNDAKALLESITRTFGYHLGKRKIRVNTISQSPTKTVAGQGLQGFDAMYEFADRIAPLGNADADSCADYTVSLLSDLTRMVTMQNLYHDGGFSTMGVSDGIMQVLSESLTKAQE